MVGKQRDSPVKVHSKEEYSPERLSGRRANETQGHSENTELRKESQKIKRFAIFLVICFLLLGAY